MVEIETVAPMMIWYKWVMLVVTALFIWAYSPLGGKLGRPSSWLFFFAILYPLGKVFQVFGVGPGFIRWYLSDVGFVPCVAVFIGEQVRFTRGYAYTRKGYEAGVVIGLAGALFVEWMQTVATLAGQSGVSRGDVMDVMLFVTTASLSVYWIERSVQYSNPMR